MVTKCFSRPYVVILLTDFHIAQGERGAESFGCEKGGFKLIVGLMARSSVAWSEETAYCVVESLVFARSRQEIVN